MKGLHKKAFIQVPHVVRQHPGFHHTKWLQALLSVDLE